MVSREINLVWDKKVLTPQEQNLRDVVKKTTLILLGGFTLLLIVIFGISFFLTQGLRNVEREVSKERDLITSLTRNEGIYLVLKQKTVALTNILSTRYPYADVYDFLKSLETEGVRITGMRLTEIGDVTIDVTLVDAVVLDNFIQSLLAAGTERFQKIEMRSINYKPEGGFLVSFIIKTT